MNHSFDLGGVLGTLRYRHDFNSFSKVCSSKPIDLEEIKMIKSKLPNATVNDALLWGREDAGAEKDLFLTSEVRWSCYKMHCQAKMSCTAISLRVSRTISQQGILWRLFKSIQRSEKKLQCSWLPASLTLGDQGCPDDFDMSHLAQLLRKVWAFHSETVRSSNNAYQHAWRGRFRILTTTILLNLCLGTLTGTDLRSCVYSHYNH